MKGEMTTGIVVSLVLFLIVAGLGFIVYKTILTSSERTAEDVSCAAQVSTHSAIVQATKEQSAPTIVCPTKEIGKQVESEDEAKEIVAQQMKRCWDIWGKGQVKLFGDKTGMYCHICSLVTVQGVPQITDLEGYMDTHEAVKGKSYSEYIAGKKYGTYFDEAKFKDRAPASMSTERPIAVVFTYGKGQEVYKKLWNSVAGNTAVGVGGGLAGGAGAGIVVYSAIAGLGIVSTGGIAAPLIIGTLAVGGGAATGGGLGLFASTWGREDSSYMAWVYARELNGSVQSLNCEYDPVSN